MDSVLSSNLEMLQAYLLDGHSIGLSLPFRVPSMVAIPIHLRLAEETERT